MDIATSETFYYSILDLTIFLGYNISRLEFSFLNVIFKLEEQDVLVPSAFRFLKTWVYLLPRPCFRKLSTDVPIHRHQASSIAEGGQVRYQVTSCYNAVRSKPTKKSRALDLISISTSVSLCLPFFRPRNPKNKPLITTIFEILIGVPSLNSDVQHFSDWGLTFSSR